MFTTLSEKIDPDKISLGAIILEPLNRNLIFVLHWFLHGAIILNRSNNSVFLYWKIY